MANLKPLRLLTLRGHRLLIRKSQTAQPVFEAEYVPVACEDEGGDAGVAVVSGDDISGLDVGGAVEAASVDDDFEAGGVDAREVARAGGLDVLRLQREGVAVDELVGDVGVVLVRLDEPEVAPLLGLPPVGVVQQQARLLARVHAELGDKVEGA